MKRFLVLILLSMAGPALADKCADLGTPALFTPESAMKAIFCEYDTAHGGTLLPLRFTAAWQMKAADTLAKPLLVATYREGDQEKGVLVVARQMLLEGKPGDSHGQTAEISVYVFNHSGEKWRYEKGKKSVTSAGSYGEAPPARLARLGKEKFGIQFESGFCNQGYCEGGLFLIPLSEPAFGIMGEFSLSGDNGGTGDEHGWEFSGAMEAVDSGSDYYLLRFVYSGTAPGEGEEPVVEHPSPVCYSHRGGRYEVVEVPACAAGKALTTGALYP